MIRSVKTLAAATMFALAVANPSIGFDFAWNDSTRFTVETRNVQLGSFDFAWADSTSVVVDTRASAGHGDSNVFTLDTLAQIPAASALGLLLLAGGVLLGGVRVFRRGARNT